MCALGSVRRSVSERRRVVERKSLAGRGRSSRQSLSLIPRDQFRLSRVASFAGGGRRRISPEMAGCGERFPGLSGFSFEPRVAVMLCLLGWGRRVGSAGRIAAMFARRSCGWRSPLSCFAVPYGINARGSTAFNSSDSTHCVTPNKA